MMSTTGRMPVMAAPTPMPAMPASEIGESITRSRAKFLHQSRQNFERRSRFGDVFTDDEHRRIAAHFFGKRFVDRLAEGDFARSGLWFCMTQA